jgi:hypothetical protein
VTVQADVHDWLALLDNASMGKHGDSEKVPNLQQAYNLVIKRIQLLASQGLTSMMVLLDFLLKRIAHLQHRACLAWLHTEDNDTVQLEHGHSSDLDLKVLDTMLMKLSPNPISTDFIITLAACAPICLDQSVWSKLLKELPTLDNIDITARQMGGQSRGVQIPGIDAARGQGHGNWSHLRQGKGTGPGIWVLHQDGLPITAQRHRRVVCLDCRPREEVEVIPQQRDPGWGSPVG